MLVNQTAFQWNHFKADNLIVFEETSELSAFNWTQITLVSAPLFYPGLRFMTWTSSKIKAGLWVQAQIRTCDLNCIPLMVRHKGDPDSGAIVLKLDRGAEGCSVLSQVRDLDGNPGWMYGGGGELISDSDAES